MYVISTLELNITMLSTNTIIVMIVTLHSSRTKMTKLLDRMFRNVIYIYKWGVIMANLMMTLQYIIKNSTDQAYIDMATDLFNELKSYDKFGDDYTRIDDKFKIMNSKQIAQWLCKNYYIESDCCDCENCIYGGNCNE